MTIASGNMSHDNITDLAADPVGHQEDSTGHQNGVGHDHASTGFANGQGHQKFHEDDDNDKTVSDTVATSSDAPDGDAGPKATPVGHQEDSTGHQNGVGHDHASTGYANGEGHQKFHEDDDNDKTVSDTVAKSYEEPGDEAGPKATPVGHQEDSTGHQNGVGHDHASTGFANGEGHQKFHEDDDDTNDATDIMDALFNLPPLPEDDFAEAQADDSDADMDLLG